MSPYRRYDLTNWFDRDSIRGNVESALRKASDYYALHLRLVARGVPLPGSDATAALDNLRRIRNIRDRLDALDQAALPEKRGAR